MRLMKQGVQITGLPCLRCNAILPGVADKIVAQSWWQAPVCQACLLCEQSVAGLQTACFVSAVLLAESALELVGAHARQQSLQLTHSVGF